MAIRQQAYQVILELFNGTTGAKWVDVNPSNNIIEEINIDIYKDGVFMETRNPDSRISDNLILFTLTGGSSGDTDAGSVFIEGTYTGIDDIIVSSVQILLDDFDSISITEPNGRATNFREMVIQIWMRFFNKVDKTSSQIRVYNKDDSIITTQSHTTGATDTVDKAS